MITSVDLIQASKCRVFGEVPKKKQAHDNKESVEDAKLEENPKLKLVADVLKEIRENEDNKVLGREENIASSTWSYAMYWTDRVRE